LQPVPPSRRSENRALKRERREWLIEGRAPRSLEVALAVAALLHVGAAVVYTLTHRSPQDTIVLPLSFRVSVQPAFVPPSAHTPAPRVSAPVEPSSDETAEPVPVPPKHAAIVPKPERAAHAGGGASAVFAPKRSETPVEAPTEVEIGAGSVSGNFEFGYYLVALRNAIQRAWAPPRGAATGHPLDAKVRFTVHREGQVTDIEVERSSGLSYFDQAAFAAVRNAALPPLPRGYESDELVVHFGFHYAE
jgi:protein TonB